MHSIILCSLISLILLGSCKGNITKDKLKSNNTIDIDLNSFGQHITDASVILEQKVIELETNNQAIIGRVDKVLISKEKIYILDRNQTKALLIFDANGKFLRRIKKLGSGPGEYVNLFDFAVDDQENIYILDAGRKKFIKYDSNGKFLEEYQTKFRSMGLSHLENDSFVFFQRSIFNKSSENQNYNIIYQSISKGTLQKSFPYHKVYDTRSFPKYYLQMGLFISENSMLYRPIFSDSVFDVSKRDIIPKYVFHCGEKKIPESYFLGKSKQQLKEDILNLKERDYIWKITNIFENDKYMVCNFSFKKSSYFLFYSKKSQNYMVKNFRNLHRGEKAKGDMQPLGVYKDYFIGIDRHSSLNGSSANKYDNPYLVLYKIRDF